MLNAANNLKASGAEGIVLCANTMHLFADRLEEKIDLPIIHIATATATEIGNRNLKKVALLGTKITMEKDFFKDKLLAQNIEVIIPEVGEREFINRTIFEELGKEIILPATKAKYLSLIQELITRGAEGIILGCTEIPLLIKQEDVRVPVFDTTRIHSAAAVQFSLEITKN